MAESSSLTTLGSVHLILLMNKHKKAMIMFLCNRIIFSKKNIEK